jgi:hypothetical protein
LLLVRLHVHLLCSNNENAMNICIYVYMHVCVGMYGEGILAAFETACASSLLKQ